MFWEVFLKKQKADKCFQKKQKWVAGGGSWVVAATAVVIWLPLWGCQMVLADTTGQAATTPAATIYI